MSAHCSIPEASALNRAALTIALAGNPNSGKTTVFNALTGLRQKVANYPGVTVEKKTGRCKLADGRAANVIDLPGTYSLISRSLDEHIAANVLRGLQDDTPVPDVVVVVVDASNLQRNLYLVSQLIEVGRPMVIALNMMDVAERRGIQVDPKALEEQIGVPVVPIVGHKRQGIEQLKRAIENARIAPVPVWTLPDEMQREITTIQRTIDALPSPTFTSGSFAERLLIGDESSDLTALKSNIAVTESLRSSHSRLQQLGIDPMQADIEAHYRWIDSVAHGRSAHATLDYAAPPKHLSEKIDAILVHKIWGLLIFALIMGALFVSIFWMAQPIMDALKNVIDHVGRYAAGLLPDGALRDLIKDGIFAGVGTVIVFVPQIALLFLFIAIMEDSGYLARAAFLMDRLLSKVGLHGKSFIPLLSSFACAIPGIMATRTIESRRDRLATIFIAPFMSCSARLPVYTLLIGTFFATFSAAARGGMMLALYALGIIAAVITAFAFRLGAKKQCAQTFILELPTYKLPQLSQVLRQVWTNSWAFLAKAGTTIFCLSVILWAMAYYPRLPKAQLQQIEARARTEYSTHMENLRKSMAQFESVAPDYTFDHLVKPDEQAEVEKTVAGEQLRYSIAGRMGHAIEPVLKPLGFDWKMGVGLVGAFAAREVFVSTMGIVYSVGDVEDDTADLSKSMLADKYPNGKKVWTPLVAVSLLVWFVLAMQCMSTIAIVRRETGGWKWPIIMLVYMNALAYVACLVVYQVGRIWFV